jgi:apolipoprotein N-acyltransferase
MPWGSLAATQTHTLMAHGIAPVFGGPGVVAIVVAANAGWAALSSVPSRIADADSPNLPAVAAALLAATVAVLVWPTPAPPNGPPENRVLRAVLVPSDLGVPTPEASSVRLRHYIGRTLSLVDSNSRSQRPASAPPQLVIWPESASAGDVSRGKTLVALNEVATLVNGDIILGSDTRDHGREYNSMYLVTSGPFDFQRYDKRQLVPFGEYVPAGFRALFGRKATAGDEDYTVGDRAPVLSWRGRQLGVAICFESTLPKHMALAVRNGAQVLIVIANDAWLTPAARTHHLRLTTLRALEVGRDALFVSNGGLSAHVSGGQVVRDAPANGLPIAVEARLDTAQTLWVEWGTKMPFALAGFVILVRLVVRGLVGLWRPRSPGLPMG